MRSLKDNFLTISDEFAQDLYTKESWEFSDNGFYTRCYLLGENVLISKLKGKFTEKGIIGLYRCYDQVLEHIRHRKITLILDNSEASGLTPDIRKLIDKHDETYRVYWEQIYMILSPSGSAIFSLYKLFNPKRVRNIVRMPNMNEALQHLNGKVQSPHKTAAPASNTNSVAELQQKVNELEQQLTAQKENEEQKVKMLFEKLGRITWDNDFQPFEIPVAKNDAFYDLFSLTQIIERDFQKVLQEQQQQNKQLEDEVSKQTQFYKEKEATLRAIINSTESIVWFIDTHFTLSEFNEHFITDIEQRTGITPKRGMNVLEVPEFRETFMTWKSRYEEAFQGNESSYEDLENTPKGLVIHSHQIFPVKAHNTIIGAVVFSYDITQKKKEEERIRHNEQLLSSVNRNLTEAIYRSTPKEGLIYINEAFVKIFGYSSKDEVFNAPSLDLYANGMQRKELSDRLLQEKSFSNIEVEFKRKNGERFWGLLSSQLTQEEDGKFYFDGAIRDITEQRNAEEKIKQNEQLITSINRNISEAIYRSTPDGRIIYANDAFVKIFELGDKQEALAYNSKDLYVEEEQRKTLIHELNVHHSVANMEILLKTAQNHQFWGSISCTLTEEPDGQGYIDGAIRDISASREAAKKLAEQNEELKKLNSELDSFVYSASHDLKAPLSSVKGLINIAQKDEDEQNRQNYFRMILRSINKLDEFIQDIIHLSRNSRLDVKHDPIDFKALIEEIFENHQYLQQSTDIEKNIVIEGESAFFSDSRRISIILNNLISNAIRYRDQDKPKSFILIKVELRQGKAMIIVEDNGQGISEEHLDKVFQMFYRASEDSEGSGLGLYIVQESVQKLHGMIDIKSTPGKGTRFILTLPSLR